jgi:hypothetical protein
MLRKGLIILLIVGVGSVVFGQLTGNNLFEYQLGNLPYSDPADMSSHYDQLNLGYRYKGLKATLRYEHFFSQNEGSSYATLSQFQVQYRKEKLELKVGNFNETLGNGLLVRGYDIAGSVFEEEAYRTRYGFYRDMLGFSAKYSGDIWYFQALRGKSLVNTLPPTLPMEDRRIDLVEGMETGVSFFHQTLGIILMRNSNSTAKDNFYSLLFSGTIPGIVSYNFEFAHDITNDLPLFGLEDKSRYGMYGSMSYSNGGFGASLEYKNYHNMLIGTGISDPPTAVKEHKYKVLNRSIHVPQLVDESGIQLEAYYTFSNREHLVFNYTYALNELYETYRFNELFVEYSFYPGQRNNVSLFADYTSDEFKFEDTRYAAGGVWEVQVLGSWSAQLHLEYQYVERTFDKKQEMHNGVVILGVSKSSDLNLSLVWEMSNDPYLTDRPDTPEPETVLRNWPGLEASYRINPTNTISLFAGKRRGGPACTSGICYEVLDFEGVEIRFRTKF